MPTYTYNAETKLGEQSTGVIEANSPALAAAYLREQGLIPIKIATSTMACKLENSTQSTQRPSSIGQTIGLEALDPPGPRGRFSMIQQLSRTFPPLLEEVQPMELATFYRQLAAMLHAGMPMVLAINGIRQQTTNATLKKILEDTARAVSVGRSLSDAMDAYPNVFNRMQCALIRAGELGGMLEGMCSRLAHYLEREVLIRTKLKRETLKPKITLFIAGIVVLILSWTQAGMGQAGLDVVWSKLLFVFSVALIGCAAWWIFQFLNKHPKFGAVWDELRMLIPGTGSVTRAYATAQFARALGALYAAGVLLPTAVDIAARSCGNRAIASAMIESVPVLMHGGGLSEMLASSGLLSDVAVQMARTGDQTGSIDAMMDKVADYLESDADSKSHQLAMAAGVGMLLFAGVIVGILVIGFYGGYFSSITNGSGSQ